MIKSHYEFLPLAKSGTRELKNGEVFDCITVQIKNAVLSFESRGIQPNAAFVRFEKGYVNFPSHFWSPEEFSVFRDSDYSLETKEFPLEDSRSYQYPHGSGFRYEQDHVYDMIRSGKKESNTMPLETSLRLVEIIDEVRRQLGVKFPVDDQL